MSKSAIALIITWAIIGIVLAFGGGVLVGRKLGPGGGVDNLGPGTQPGNQVSPGTTGPSQPSPQQPDQVIKP